jgi:hypothetical protein
LRVDGIAAASDLKARGIETLGLCCALEQRDHFRRQHASREYRLSRRHMSDVGIAAAAA